LRATGLFPQGAVAVLPMLVAVALINIIYGSLLALRQTDLKAMVAYSSVSHMGFVLLGVASANTTGFIGATMQMLTHGVTTGALFLLVGALYERTHTRDIRDYGGLASKVPALTVVMSLAILTSMGLPGLAGFVSELHALVGGFERWSFLVALASVGVLITAAYSLRSIRSLFLGAMGPKAAAVEELSPRELAAIAPLGVLMVGVGVAPGALLDLITATIGHMAAIFG
jgi:NADH-quinone oxidoreductase subunit M